MRILFIVGLCISLNISVHAQDNNKPYTEMTIQELRLIEPDSLSKSDKKQYKKALKAARKAEKKRIKAEKKAERARKKAEKKRLKAEAKVRKKALKQARKVYKYANTIYEDTYFIKDDFEATIQIRGANTQKYDMQTLGRLGNGGNITYFLRSFYNPSTGLITTQLYATVKFSEAVVNADMQNPTISPELYAAQHGWWKGFHSASLRGGIALRFNPIRRRADTYCEYYCSFHEEFAIDLLTASVIQAANTDTSLDIKINSQRAGSMILSVPWLYLTAYLARLSELDTTLADYGAKAKAEMEKMRLDASPP
ncbi:remorin family protein [Kordiimonas aquimaris]|uniref:remorin family protein n=1 Tax=Kordiimonas aquimaris TaxID=707591 RepID=UPI0021D1C365|nr:remorin family protein [Kordiimonas aquimaris]